MESPSLRTLKESSDHLGVLSGILDHPMAQLRAAHFRKSERSLTHISSVFSPEFASHAGDWTRTKNSVVSMKKNLVVAQDFDSKRQELKARLEELEENLAEWGKITPEKRAKWKSLVSLARTHLDSDNPELEAKARDRFEMYLQLKPLVPYAEEVDHLCSAVKHYAKRDEYEAEKEALEAKIVSAEMRCKSVRRGFFLSLILCVLIVTIPLCIPFAFSLWNRIREIEKQLSQHTEARRRVLRRLELADEGVIAAEDITAILGERSLFDIRNILEEVRSLNREFGPDNKVSSVLTKLIVAEQEEREDIIQMFGEPPKEFREKLAWMVRSVSQKQRQSEEIVRTADEILELQNKTKEQLKGYNIEILSATISRLEKHMESILDCELTIESKERLMELAKDLPSLSDRIRSALSRASYAKEVTKQEWLQLRVEVKSASTTLNAIVLDGILSAEHGFDDNDWNEVNE